MLALGIVSLIAGIGTLFARRWLLTEMHPIPFVKAMVERRGLIWSEVARKKIVASGIFFTVLGVLVIVSAVTQSGDAGQSLVSRIILGLLTLGILVGALLYFFWVKGIIGYK